MHAAGWMEQPAAGRVTATLVLEHPLEHQDLLAAAALEQTPLHSGHRRGDPGKRGGVEHHRPAQVGMELHRQAGRWNQRRTWDGQWRGPSSLRSFSWNIETARAMPPLLSTAATCQSTAAAISSQASRCRL